MVDPKVGASGARGLIRLLSSSQVGRHPNRGACARFLPIADAETCCALAIR
jgi:hypothetical protein